MTRALVTGGTGFAGRYLVRHLSDSAVDVHATAHASHHDAPGATAVHPLDVSDRRAVLALIEELQPDEIYHLAGATRPASGDVAGFYDVNLGGARNVLEAAAAHVPGAKVLLVGSAYAYAASNGPIAEDWPLTPTNHYGASKGAAEMIGRAYAADGLHVVLARPFNHSGPGQSPDFVLPTIVEQVRRATDSGAARAVLDLGNLSPVRDISDVRDVVVGYVVALRRGEPSQAYNLGSGTGRTIGQIADLVATHASIDVDIRTDDARVRDERASILVADISRMRSLGWAPARDLDVTVNDMLAIPVASD